MHANSIPRHGKIMRSEEPLNLEMPFQKLDGFVTSIEDFYVRTHFPIPNVDKAGWRLRVEGEVENRLALTFEQLLEFQSMTMPVTLECAGNNRNFLEPKMKGVQWGLGAVGTAEWTGVPLSAVLDRAGIKASALEVILEGADEGVLEEPKTPHGKVRFARSLPLAKARDVLLAHKMNGLDLPVQHGFPVRAIVPGWFAMASIKWLERIIVTDRPFNGYYQTLDYAYWSQAGGLARLVPLSEMQVKAEIARPAPNEIVPTNSRVVIAGAAWTGKGEITRVEVSTDGGRNWNEAELLGAARVNAWRLWQFLWQTPNTAGRQVLMARATDSSSCSQPTDHDPNRGSYMINRLLPIEIEVR